MTERLFPEAAPGSQRGRTRAAALAMASTLADLGLAPPPDSLVSRVTTNTRGEVVGELRVFGALER